MKHLYIHIPFCKSICSYCDFCKMYHNSEFVNNYLDALRKEPAPEVATAESPIQLPYIQTDNPYLPIILDQNTQFKDGLPQDPVRQCLDNQAQQMAANIVQPGKSILTFPVFEQNFFMNPFTEVMPAACRNDDRQL